MSDSPNPLLPPPTLEQQIAMLIGRHGKDAVAAAVKAATRPPRGRRAEGDWKRLREWVEADVGDWLEGRDPLKLRPNTRIAKEFASKYPGHSESATIRRIQKKLSKLRKWFLFAHAQHLTQNEHPYTVHLKAFTELARIDPKWGPMLETRKATLARYRVLFGDPDPQLTWDQVSERPYRNALAAYMPKRSGGMFGNASS